MELDTSSFSSRFSFEDEFEPNEDARLCVIGVGGGGGNAINNMVAQGIHGVEFFAINTDSQALTANKAPHRLQAGRALTKGLGAGARPSIGAQAVDESREEIEAALRDFNMAFITAGMGGGTGTGGAPVVAAIAKSLGILTVAIVTKPFDCEGKKRLKQAEAGIELLKETVDTLIVIPNERLLDIAEENTTLVDAFVKADEVLYNATRGISDLITVHGLINLDFADVKTTMENGGTALMGSAVAEGENRAERAAIEAISSPLLDGLAIAGARNVLVNITAGRSLGIREATQATSIIQREAGDDVEVIFGTVIDETMGDELRITVIATGFDKVEQEAPEGLRRTVPLRAEGITPHYKGEENLKQLDVPAYVRRSTPFGGPAPAEEEPEEKTMHLLPKDAPQRERSEIPPPKKGSNDTPAFLRNMMD